MGLFFEPGLQAWAQSEHWIVTGANWMYVNSHFVVTTTFLIWLYIARNHSYYYVRNMFMIAMGLALVGYLAYPTAPPRYMPEWGFTDTVAAFVGDAAEQSANVLYNPYAAVPSMHVAFALMIAIPAIKLVKSRALKVAWGLYPLLVTFVVVVTANHFWLDAALGALVAAVVGLGRLLRAGARPARGVGVAHRAAAKRSRRARMASAPRERPRDAGARRASCARNRLIESRLTPNAISMTGLVGNLVAAVLVTQEEFFLAGIAFILGSVMDTLDGRYSRMSGKGTPFGAFLDSSLDRIEEGIVLAAVGAYFAKQGDELAVAAVVLAVLFSPDGQLHARPRRGAGGGVQGGDCHPRRPRSDHLGRPPVREGRRPVVDFELLEPAIYVLAALTRVHHVPARVPRAARAHGATAELRV